MDNRHKEWLQRQYQRISEESSLIKYFTEEDLNIQMIQNHTTKIKTISQQILNSFEHRGE